MVFWNELFLEGLYAGGAVGFVRAIYGFAVRFTQKQEPFSFSKLFATVIIYTLGGGMVGFIAKDVPAAVMGAMSADLITAPFKKK